MTAAPASEPRRWPFQSRTKNPERCGFGVHLMFESRKSERAANMIPKPNPKLPPDDDELACRVAAGDRTAFEPLMRRHNALLYRVARSILRDDAEAEDAVQEAYLSAFRNFGSFRG